MKLGEKIRELRLKKQLTQREVAGDYMTRNMLSKLENGSAVPSVKTLEHLSRVLETPVSYFIDEEEGLCGPGLKEQAEKIDLLAAGLEQEEAPRLRALGACIRARLLLGQAAPERAYEVMTAIDRDQLEADSLVHVYQICEECCKAKGDFEKAYEYAVLRMELMVMPKE